MRGMRGSGLAGWRSSGLSSQLRSSVLLIRRLISVLELTMINEEGKRESLT
jgi:hypothetical protein